MPTLQPQPTRLTLENHLSGPRDDLELLEDEVGFLASKLSPVLGVDSSNEKPETCSEVSAPSSLLSGVVKDLRAKVHVITQGLSAIRRGVDL